MRLFFAINFSAATLGRLIQLRDQLRAEAARGNFSRPENLHLTLAFLGECDSAQSASALEALASLAFHPFSIAISQTGSFARRGGGAILWAGLDPSAALTNLQRGLADKLRARGFALENRPFTPHITLGREAVPRQSFRLGAIDPVSDEIRRVDLMKSEHIAGRLTYTAIASLAAS